MVRLGWGPRSAARCNPRPRWGAEIVQVMTTIVASDPTRTCRALSLDDLRRRVPSVFAANARPGVSSRYTFVSTAEVVHLLREEGWEPVNAHQQRVRVAPREGFQMHEVRFARRADLERSFEVGETRPELVLQNAHDGTRAYRIDAGLYRLVCRNGLTVADADFAHVAIRHVDVAPEKFIGAARAVAENTPRVLDTVARWQAVALTELAQLEFARRASALRWDPDQPIARAVTPGALMSPLRYGDDKRDLWTTFNVVQEHLLRGGDRYSGGNARGGTRRNTTRPVGSLILGQTLNKALWQLAEEFSRN
jgi:hypothetical protein